jgi:hypothetical protein
LLSFSTLLTSLRVSAHGSGAVTRIDDMATREFTPLRTLRAGRGAEAESSSRLVDLSARSEEGDYDERHYSHQNVDNAAHQGPASSSYRLPFRR